MNSASLCSLAGRYDNPLPPRFPAPIASSKIPALVFPLFTLPFWLCHSGLSVFTFSCWLCHAGLPGFTLPFWLCPSDLSTFTPPFWLCHSLFFDEFLCPFGLSYSSFPFSIRPCAVSILHCNAVCRLHFASLKGLSHEKEFNFLLKWIFLGLTKKSGLFWLAPLWVWV